MTDDPSNYQVESLGILDLLRMVVGPNTFLRRSLDTPMISWKYDCMTTECLDRMEITERVSSQTKGLEWGDECRVYSGMICWRDLWRPRTLVRTLGCQELEEFQTYETSWWFHICFIFTLTWKNDPSWRIHIFYLGWVLPNIWNSWSSLHPWTLGYSIIAAPVGTPLDVTFFKGHMSQPHTPFRTTKTSYFLHTFETWFDEKKNRAKKNWHQKFSWVLPRVFFLLKGWLFALVFQGAWHTHQVSEFNTIRGLLTTIIFPE